jgi:hypothetical protein
MSLACRNKMTCFLLSCEIFGNCDVFAHFPPNYIFISFFYLTLNDMTVKNIIETVQQALQNEIYL